MCKNNNDLIDFPCSDTFLNYYHEIGLTPRHSPDYQNLLCKGLHIEKVLKELTEEIKNLNLSVLELQNSKSNYYNQRHRPFPQPEGTKIEFKTRELEK